METKKIVPAGKSRQYPAVSMTEAFELCEKAGKYPTNKPISYNALAKEYNLKNANTKTFRYRISTAKQLGLLNTSRNTLSLTDWGCKVAHPASQEETKKIKRLCFCEPQLYKELIRAYNRSSIPNNTALENILVRDYGIKESVKKNAAKIFIEMAQEAEMVNAGVLNVDDEITDLISENNHNNDETKTENEVFNGNDFELTIPNSDNGYEHLIIPLGQQRKAMLYMPTNASREDADFVKEIIDTTFKRLYRAKELE